MSALLTDRQQEVLAELEGLPDQHFPVLLKLIRNNRESLLHQSATDSFRRGWEEAQGGMTTPVDHLWEGIDAE